MMKFRLWLLIGGLFLFFALCHMTCSDDDSDSTDPVDEDPVVWYDFSAYAPWFPCPQEAFPEEATLVNGFDQEYQYFGDENRREVWNTVQFPDRSDWSQVGLLLSLQCPENGKCDHWDRSGSVQIVANPEADQAEWEYIELVRYVTPYRIEMCFYIDITPLAPHLKGEQILSSWIDTWVGPGHSAGEGWRTSVTFVFYPGPPGGADDIVNIWQRRSITVGYIDADNNVDSQIEPVTVTIPDDAKQVMARLITTGHSFGNTFNCAEFCQMRQDVIVNGTPFSVNPWRSDCEANPASPQYGTWKYDRNGWCPGAFALGDWIDITAAIQAGGTNSLDFDIRLADGEEYHNTNPADLDPYEWISLKLYVYK